MQLYLLNGFNKGGNSSGILCKKETTKVTYIDRDVNGFIKNSLKMSGSRGRIGPGGVKGPLAGGPGGREKLNFHTITAEKLASPGQKWVKIRRLERINNEEILPNIIT